MSNETVVTYITNSVTDEDCSMVVNRLSKELPIKFNRLRSVQEAFPLLSDPNYHTDYFTIDVEIVYANGFTDVFSLINTLKTLIDSTVSRDSTGKTKPRKTKILGIVGLSTDPRLIKEILKMPALEGLTLRYEPGITYEDLFDSCQKIINEDYTIPKKIQDRLRNKKTVKEEEEISLTPRQTQILMLISQRGASNKVIAKTLGITESTVKLHVGAILKKYGLRNRTQLAVFSKKENPY